MKKILILYIFIVFSISVFGDNILFSEGKTTYKIILSTEASSTEKTAARELQHYLKEVGGVNIPISYNPSDSNGLYIGYSNYVGNRLKVSRPMANDDSFYWVTRGDDYFIYGGSNRGTMYGVYDFLEQKLGVTWLTWDCTIIKKHKSFIMSDFNKHEIPYILYRHPFYYDAQNHIDWDAHNKVNGISGSLASEIYGAFGGFWGVHTFQSLLPAKEYFASHPEYFSLRNGKRVKDGQLCLSNPSVIKILETRILSVIKNNSSFRVFSVSQNDNQYFCECNRCKAIERKYGGHSGLIIWMINQVARKVGKVYPNVYISTLAYQYSQQPPVNIKPRSNVFIQLTDIGCCFSHSFSAEENAAFRKDLEGWSRITNNIFVWDYVTNFFHYLLPYPNVKAINENYKLLAKYHVNGVMAEGQYQSSGTGFDNMKAWLISKLLWNPYYDVDSLAKVFIYGYYGKAAPVVYKYYSLCNNQVTQNIHLKFTSEIDYALYSDAFLESASKLIDQALLLNRDSPYIYNDRVQKLQIQLLYMKVQKNRIRAEEDGSFSRFLFLLDKYKANINEGTSAEKFLKSVGDT